MTRTIPAQVIRECDVCKNVAHHRNNGTIIFSRITADLLNNAMGECKSRIDLCDGCTQRFETMLERWQQHRVIDVD